jgi:hypothetical protein
MLAQHTCISAQYPCLKVFQEHCLKIKVLPPGGLMKELLEQVVAAGTQPEYGLAATTEDTGLLYPNPTAEAIPQGLALLEFLGRWTARTFQPWEAASAGLQHFSTEWPAWMPLILQGIQQCGLNSKLCAVPCGKKPAPGATMR